MLIRKAAVNNFQDALKLVEKTGADSRAHTLLAKKALLVPVIIENIDNRAANILKQEAIRVGADAAVSENVGRFKQGFSNVALFATLRQCEILKNKLSAQPLSALKEVSAVITSGVAARQSRIFKYKNKVVDLKYPAVMGIINLDPKSFSQDGLTNIDKAVEQAVRFEKEGAKIIDIGAESSRPGSRPLDAKTEIKRLLPALKKIRKAVKAPISIDTYKYETAKAALAEGADIINDIFALQKGGDKLAKLTAQTKAGIILMHMQGNPKTMQKAPKYKDVVSEVYEFLLERKNYALSFGIKEENIAVDPGIGFGKTASHNFELIKNLKTFSALGAVVGAVSRKRFVKETAGAETTSFVAVNLLAAFCGANIIRAHDVKETVNALKLIKAAGEI